MHEPTGIHDPSDSDVVDAMAKQAFGEIRQYFDALDPAEPLLGQVPETITGFETHASTTASRLTTVGRRGRWLVPVGVAAAVTVVVGVVVWAGSPQPEKVVVGGLSGGRLVLAPRTWPQGVGGPTMIQQGRAAPFGTRGSLVIGPAGSVAVMVSARPPQDTPGVGLRLPNGQEATVRTRPSGAKVEWTDKGSSVVVAQDRSLAAPGLATETAMNDTVRSVAAAVRPDGTVDPAALPSPWSLVPPVAQPVVALLLGFNPDHPLVGVAGNLPVTVGREGSALAVFVTSVQFTDAEKALRDSAEILDQPVRIVGGRPAVRVTKGPNRRVVWAPDSRTLAWVGATGRGQVGSDTGEDAGGEVEGGTDATTSKVPGWPELEAVAASASAQPVDGMVEVPNGDPMVDSEGFHVERGDSALGTVELPAGGKVRLLSREDRLVALALTSRGAQVEWSVPDPVTDPEVAEQLESAGLSFSVLDGGEVDGQVVRHLVIVTQGAVESDAFEVSLGERKLEVGVLHRVTPNSTSAPNLTYAFAALPADVALPTKALTIHVSTPDGRVLVAQT